MELAKILYDKELPWEGFPQNTKRGVLKIQLKGKWRKRLVALRDNFIFLFRPSNEEYPIDCIKLVNVVISTDHRKLPPNSFCVKTSSIKQLLFCAASFEIMTQWMQALTFTKPWYEEVPNVINLRVKKASNLVRNPKVERASKSNTSTVIQKARNTLRKYSAGQ